jgi:L-aspartate oxidase
LNIHRYLVNFNSNNIETEFVDVSIIGTGVAGMYTSLKIPERNKIVMFSKDTTSSSCSMLAQGGIAVPFGKDDSHKLHFNDTIYAGDGLCDEKAVKVLIEEAHSNIETLCQIGVCFNKTKDGKFSFTKEAAH